MSFYSAYLDIEMNLERDGRQGNGFLLQDRMNHLSINVFFSGISNINSSAMFDILHSLSLLSEENIFIFFRVRQPMPLEPFRGYCRQAIDGRKINLDHFIKVVFKSGPCVCLFNQMSFLIEAYRPCPGCCKIDGKSVDEHQESF